nr:hypothetical protein [uncultured Allomuricauda sp.]
MRLFRTIRRAMITEGDIRKYLLYALGEISLIMLGILLAFQINKWDDKRLQRKAELTFYRNIKEQIISDRETIEVQIAYNGKYAVQYNHASEIIESNDRSQVETLGKIALDLSTYSEFDGWENIYQTIVNSGEIKLIGKPEIIDGFRKLEERYIHINRIENIHYEAMMTFVIPSIKPAIRFSTGEVLKQNDLYSHEFQNVIVSLLRVMYEKDQIYREAIEEIDKIIGLIEIELFEEDIK